jgi:hypothetical protein
MEKIISWSSKSDKISNVAIWELKISKLPKLELLDSLREVHGLTIFEERLTFKETYIVAIWFRIFEMQIVELNSW